MRQASFTSYSPVVVQASALTPLMMLRSHERLVVIDNAVCGAATGFDAALDANRLAIARERLVVV